jgi:hypothetical protein
MNTRSVLAVAVMSVLFGACAGLKPKKAAVACQNAPQWFSNDASGKPAAAVYVCFGEKHELLWESRALTAAEIAAMTAPAAAPRNRPDAQDMAEIAKRKAIFSKKADAKELDGMAKRLAAVKRKAAAQRSADPCSELEGPDYTACRIDQNAAKAPGEGLKEVK